VTAESLDPSDEELVRCALRGQRDAFGTLVSRHQDAVWRLVRRLARVDRAGADDLAQDVFVRAFQGLGSFRFECPFKHWILRIARNLTLNRVTTMAAKTERTMASLDASRGTQDDRRIDPVDPHAAQPEDGMERAELKHALWRALEKLAQEFREAVLLRDVEGLDYEAIANVLELPIGTVRSRIHRGREALKEILTRGLDPTLRLPNADGVAP
jgi:RNA polymerase sigma-70 factor (ECF subfamily)